jgi:regulator of sigma E protease
LLSFLIAIFALCVIILIHEIGHWGAAKIFGMKVHQFNLGMGPIIFKKQINETQYGLRAFPIGGSCVLGEDDEDVEADDPHAFRNKPVWQRIIVISAGAFLNLVLGVILCIVINIALPIPSLTVAKFTEDAVSNTGISALRTDDKIVSVNGMWIVSSTEIAYKMDNSAVKGGFDGDTAAFEFVVIRDGERVTLPDVRFAAKPNEQGGITYARDFSTWAAEKSFINVLFYSVRDAVGFGRIIWLSLIDIIRGTYGINEVSGPVGIAGVISDATERAANFSQVILMIVRLSALITINLGIVNLLPIPALDGGRIIFLTLEGIRRKSLKAETEGVIHFVGFALLILLIVVVTFNDIRKLIFGG